MRFLHRKRKYADRKEAAEREVRVSRTRLEVTRREVAEPLAGTGRHNKFAEMIRSSVIDGYRQRGSA